MATKSYMIQFYTEQYVDALVSTVFSLDDEAFLFLDPAKNTIIREIATETLGGVLASSSAGLVPIGITDGAFAELKLVFPKRENPEYFYAPSHVPSPPIGGAGLAVLRVYETGFKVAPPGELSLYRGIGAHAYIDQV